MLDAPPVQDGEEWGMPPVTDAHVHINRFDLMKPACYDLISQNPTFKQVEALVANPGALADFLFEEGVDQVWAINYCAQDVMGYGQEVNAWASDYCKEAGDVVRSTGGYDPRHDGDGGDAARTLEALGLIGAKIHPVHQHLSPDAHRQSDAIGTRMRAFYEEMARRKMPVWFHTGTSIFPGADNAFQGVGPVAHVAADFPTLQVVLCHSGRPNETQEAVAMAEAHPNVWLELSSMPPRRIPEWYPQAETLQERLIWGSDWPGPKVPGMGANVLQFLALGYPEPFARAILHDNAQRLIGQA